MFSFKVSSKKILTTLILSSCLLTGGQAITLASGNSGLTLWSGVARENILNYHLDFGGRANRWGERYRLRLPAKKMTQGVSKVIISYPDYYDGTFDPNKIQVNYGRKYKTPAKISEVFWDQENHYLEITLEEATPAEEKVEIKLSNVKNPDGGTYYFNCRVFAPGQSLLPYAGGTWIVSID